MYKNAGSRLLTPTILPIFRYWLVGIVLLVAISPTDIPFVHRIYVALLYSCLFAYPVLIKPGVVSREDPGVNYKAADWRVSGLLLMIQIVCTSLAAIFYTGTDLASAVYIALTGGNTYSAYQQHFSEMLISSKPIYERAIYASLLCVAKLILVYSTINHFLAKSRNIITFTFLLLTSATYLSFGLARGTFFEFFETACVIIYFWFMTAVHRKGRTFRRNKTIFVAAAVGAFLLIALFVLNAMRRYEDSSSFFEICSQNFCYTPTGIFGPIEYALFLLTVYFGNGALFIARLFEVTLTHGYVSYLIPLNAVINSLDSPEFGVRAYMCGRFFQCKYVWTPEVASVISIFGVFAIFVSNIGIILMAKFERSVLRRPTLPGIMLSYFVFMLAMSMPVANFFTISSPSILAAAVLAGLVVARRLRVGTARENLGR